jgi:hypothetical protein
MSEVLTINVRPHEELDNVQEGCFVLDKSNVLILDFSVTGVGYNTKINIGLAEYGGNVVSRWWDRAQVIFYDYNENKMTSKPMRVKDGELKCFLEHLPAFLRFHDKLFKLEYWLV